MIDFGIKKDFAMKWTMPKIALNLSQSFKWRKLYPLELEFVSVNGRDLARIGFRTGQ